MTPFFDHAGRSILLLGSQMAIGGAQHILLAQARWFHQQGYRVTVAFFYDKEGLFETWQKNSPFPLINLNGWRKKKSPANGFRLIRALIRLYVLLIREKFIVVETFTHTANLLGLPLAWAATVPVRIASHHGRFEDLTPWMERSHRMMINLGIATRMVAVSTSVSALAVKLERINPDRVTVIHNGIDLSLEFNLNEEERILLRQSLEVKPDNFLIITVGRLVNQKGHSYLLEAMSEILRRFPRTVLVIVGDGPLRTILDAQVRELHIEEAVRFTGTRKDVPCLLSLADCFVLPSLWEGLPVALLEAMRAGLPIIATNVEGAREVIIDGENGLLVTPADANALSQAIQRLIADDPIRVRIGAEGKAKVMKEFGFERMCQQYETLFKQELTASKNWR